MAKGCNTTVLDGLLDVVATATVLTVCSAEPDTYAEATSTYKLADIVLDSGDFTKATGDVSGRKVTVAQQANVDIDSSGTATHVALSISGSSTWLYTTTCTSQVLTAGGTVTIPAFDIEVASPN